MKDIDCLNFYIEMLQQEIFLNNSNPDSKGVIRIDFTPTQAQRLRDTLQGAKQTFIDYDNLEKNMPLGIISASSKLGDTESRSPYAATVEGMLSHDYKERFKAEYQQTKIRYEKLNAFCNRIEAAMRTCPGDTKRVQMPEHDCPLDLLHDQLRAMGDYLHCLEIRAVIEGIEL